MTTKEERLAFEAHKRVMALALGKDEDAFRQVLSTLGRLDKDTRYETYRCLEATALLQDGNRQR